MTITLTQAIILGVICGVWKSCICYTIGGFNINTVIFNAVFVGLVMGDMKSAMIIGAFIWALLLLGETSPQIHALRLMLRFPLPLHRGLTQTPRSLWLSPLGC
jgi:PTS system mannose-specific IID component